MNREKSLNTLKKFTEEKSEKLCICCIPLITNVFAAKDMFSADPINAFGVPKLESKIVIILMMPIFSSILLREGILLTKAISLKTQLTLGEETFIGGTEDDFFEQMTLRNMGNVKVCGDRLNLIQYANEELKNAKERIIEKYYESLIRKDSRVKQLTCITKE